MMKPYVLFDPDHLEAQDREISPRYHLLSYATKDEVSACSPSAGAIKAYYHLAQVDSLWESHPFQEPHRYYVDLSQKLWDEKRTRCFLKAY